MPTAATKEILKGIVDRLEGTEPVAWKTEARLVHDCIVGMRRMYTRQRDPDAQKSEMAITHAEAMQKALWGHNRAAALELGRAAGEGL